MDPKARKRSPAHDPAALGELGIVSKRRSFVSSLLDWYVEVRRDLPWRRDPDPYRVWVSEVMLQQTRVETVIPYFERFLERFPTVADLAEAKEDDVLAMWSGLGYYRRARSLREGARALLDQHGGEFPRTLEEALALPGVGPYTAAAILSIAYGLPHPVVDGNVERVVARLLRWADNPRQASTKKKIRRLLERLIPEGRASDFNQAMMELGATVCVPGSPRCDECPVTQLCKGKRHGDAESYPVLPPPRKTVDVRLEAGVIRNGDHYLLERSSGTSYLEGLWLFPLVEKECDVSDIASRLSEDLGTEVRRAEPLSVLRHSITFRRLTIEPLLLDADSFEIDDDARFRWARLDELGEQIPVSSICLKIAKLIRDAAAG